MYIHNKPVLHIVDEAVWYGAVTFLSRVGSSAVWTALLNCWSLAYLGPPDFLQTDQDSQLVPKKLAGNAEADDVTVPHAPI